MGKYNLQKLLFSSYLIFTTALSLRNWMMINVATFTIFGLLLSINLSQQAEKPPPHAAEPEPVVLPDSSAEATRAPLAIPPSTTVAKKTSFTPALILSFLSFIVSASGLVATIYFKYQENARERKIAKLDAIEKQLKIDQLQLELEKKKREIRDLE